MLICINEKKKSGLLKTIVTAQSSSQNQLLSTLVITSIMKNMKNFDDNNYNQFMWEKSTAWVVEMRSGVSRRVMPPAGYK